MLQGSGLYNGGLYIMNAQFYHKGKYKCVVESTSDGMEAEADVQITGYVENIFFFRCNILNRQFAYKTAFDILH